ncbi:MAG: hypothetical protein KOO63_00215 [Bacteroidales bacterium]|nr:hypothetical protein [Candidatus Latescibacterota bacterium]
MRGLLNAVRSTYSYFHELKFSGLNRSGRGEKVATGKKWASIVLDEAKQNGALYLKILGIDRHNLNENAFGENSSKSATYAAMYNRFFRSQLIGGLKYYFGADHPIVVDEVVHDTEGNLENHEYFDWHSIMCAERDVENVSVKTNSIQFVDSDPKSLEAHPVHTEFVQFADIILGAISHCVECHNRRNEGMHEVAKVLLPLVERMSHNPRNRNSSYGYHRRYGISFFPKEKVSKSEGECSTDGLYSNRQMALKTKVSGQRSIPGIG